MVHAVYPLTSLNDEEHLRRFSEYHQLQQKIAELNNMEWNYLGSPSQAECKYCVHDVLFPTVIWLFKEFQPRYSLGPTHVKSSTIFHSSCCTSIPCFQLNAQTTMYEWVNMF